MKQSLTIDSTRFRSSAGLVLASRSAYWTVGLDGPTTPAPPGAITAPAPPTRITVAA